MKNNKKVLIVVDYQRDFASPNGSLYVPQAETIAARIQQEINDPSYIDVIYTLDTHVSENYSNSEEATIFPPHCEFNTSGWEFHEIFARNEKINEGISGNIFDTPTDFSFGNEFVFVKDKFSIWEGNNNYKNFILGRYEKDNTEFVIVGVATNYCVFQNAMGYQKLGFNTVSVIEDAVRGIMDDTFETNIGEMKSYNIKFI